MLNRWLAKETLLWGSCTPLTEQRALLGGESMRICTEALYGCWDPAGMPLLQQHTVLLTLPGQVQIPALRSQYQPWKQQASWPSSPWQKVHHGCETLFRDDKMCWGHLNQAALHLSWLHPWCTNRSAALLPAGDIPQKQQLSWLDPSWHKRWLTVMDVLYSLGLVSPIVQLHERDMKDADPRKAVRWGVQLAVLHSAAGPLWEG